MSIDQLRYSEANPIWVKYNRNLVGGRSLYEQGTISPFNGYPADHHDGISLRAYYSQDALKVLGERFIRPIDNLASNLGIHVYSAELWKPHTTVADLRYLPGTTAGTRDEVFQRVMGHKLSHEATAILAGTELEFDFVFGGNAVTIATTLIPTQILEARRMMTEVGRDLSLVEKDFSNIAHITLARMGIVRNPGLSQFSSGLDQLLESALDKPLIARVQNAEIMSNKQMEIVNEAQLLQLATTSR